MTLRYGILMCHEMIHPGGRFPPGCDSLLPLVKFCKNKNIGRTVSTLKLFTKNGTFYLL